MKNIPMMAVALVVAVLIQGCTSSVTTQQAMVPQYGNTGIYSGGDWNASLDAAMDAY